MTGIRRRQRLRVTICGTFNLGLPAVVEAVDFFHASGVAVLSPADPTPVEVVNGFLYVASDRHRDPGLVEARHLQAIAESDFVWLVAPDGYVGVAAALEVGFAIARSISVFSVDRVTDRNVGPVVQRVSSARAALERCTTTQPASDPSPFLVYPERAAADTHVAVDVLHQALTGVRAYTAGRVAVAAREIRHALSGM